MRISEINTRIARELGMTNTQVKRCIQTLSDIINEDKIKHTRTLLKFFDSRKKAQTINENRQKPTYDRSMYSF